MAINPGHYHDRELVRGTIEGGPATGESSAASTNDHFWNADLQIWPDRRKSQPGKLLRRKLSQAEIVRIEIANHPEHAEVDNRFVHGVMTDAPITGKYSAENSNDRRRNAYTQVRTERRKFHIEELLRGKLSLAEIMRDEMANHPGYNEINKTPVHSAPTGDFIVEKHPANHPNDRYWGVQALLDRRRSQTGKFWRKTQAGELLRRELSLVEISCIVFMLSAILIDYY